MKQLENNLQVLQEQEYGEGWGIFFFFQNGKGFVPM